MPKPGDEIRDGYILRPGRLRRFTARERDAANELIGAFPFGNSTEDMIAGTVVWFRGNNRGFKAPLGVELGPNQLGTHPNSIWMALPEDIKQSMRIDRQKPFTEDGKRFWDYHLQVADESIACVLVRMGVDVGMRVVRRALLMSLESVKNVSIDPADPRKGYQCAVR